MRNLFLYLLLFFMPISWAQEYTDPREMFDEGQYFFVRKDYKEALYFFKLLVHTDKDNAHYNFKVGECYINIPGQEHLGVPYLEKAALKVVPKRDYRSKDFHELEAPLHALYYLGNAYRMAGDLESALKAYNEFIDSPYFYGNYNLTVVEDEMKSCERAKIIQDSPVDYSKVALTEPITTSFSEFNPVLSHDGRKMAFVRGLKFYDAVFITSLEDGKWTKPINISPEIASEGDYYPTGMNTDGTILLFTRRFENRSDIYFSEFDGTIWSKAQKFDGRINTMANETFASFGEDDNTLYLVSDRQSGKGGKDIFKSQKQTDGSWGKPKNLGKDINTYLDEDTPFWCRKNKTLFFSSQAHYNMGGFDIFYSNQENGGWSIPRNIGHPINTTGDDKFYAVLPECNSGYLSIIDKETGIADIFYIIVKSKLAVPEE